MPSSLIACETSLILIDVPDKDSAASVVHEGFDPVPDMGRSIDSSIFVMCHPTFDATGILQHIGPTLDCRHLPYQRKSIRRNSRRRIPDRLGSQRAPHDPLSKILLLRHSHDIAADAQQAHQAPDSHTHRFVPPLLPTPALPPRRQTIIGHPIMANERQNLVTLEKLKSLRVIAGTRNLPVSDVMASAGLVKASIRLKARKGLS